MEDLDIAEKELFADGRNSWLCAVLYDKMIVVISEWKKQKNKFEKKER